MTISRGARAAFLALVALVVALPVLAQPADELQLTVRDTRLLDDGLTELIVSVTG